MSEACAFVMSQCVLLTFLLSSRRNLLMIAVCTHALTLSCILLSFLFPFLKLIEKRKREVISFLYIHCTIITILLHCVSVYFCATREWNKEAIILFLYTRMVVCVCYWHVLHFISNLKLLTSESPNDIPSHALTKCLSLGYYV